MVSAEPGEALRENCLGLHWCQPATDCSGGISEPLDRAAHFVVSCLLMQSALRWVQLCATRIGLDVRRFRPHPWLPLGLGVEVATIIDVGAADGTSELYEAFPSAKIIAIDPINEQLDCLRTKLGDRAAEYIGAAVGREDGQVELYLDRDNALKSSLNQRTELTMSEGPLGTRTVPVRRLDDLFEEGAWQVPLALKIDTEGHELAVLAGAEKTLASCAVVYCETSVAARFEGGYRFSEVANFMLDHGFELVDVIDAPVGRDGRTVFLDCVWLPAAAR